MDMSIRLRLACVAWALPASLSLLCGTALAQTPSADAEAMARAQRAADRVKELILQSAHLGNGAPAAVHPAPAPASAPARPNGAARHPPHVAAAPPPRPAPQASSDEGAPAGPRATGFAKSAAAPLASLEAASGVAVQARQAVVLFDFEDSTEGFEIHRAVDWRLGSHDAFDLSPTAAHGKSALQVRSEDDSWFGVELTESVDFTSVRRLTFYMRSDHAAPARFAMKTGSQYDWCELKPIARGRETNLIRYEVELKAPGGKECHGLDLEDVRGLQWGLRGGDTVVLDQVEMM